MEPMRIIFDLDGTLTDSGEGILNCAEMTLRYFHLPVPDRETMRVFVGPPLRDTFIQFGVPADRVEEAIEVYRSRYNTVGKFENFPYPGIQQLLEKLSRDGHIMGIATSKPEHTAIEIMQKFELDHFFTKISGATPDGSHDDKAKVISSLLAELGTAGKAVMVGDTAFDVIGAAAHGFPAIGVSWGYGKVSDMIKAGAAAIVDTPEELYYTVSHM